MSDVEKSFQAPPQDVYNMPNEVWSKQPSSDDPDLSEIAEDKPETEKQGSIKDYFVSGESKHSY